MEQGQQANPEVLGEAVARLKSGRLVAFPTETVYGLGADALSDEAVGRVFAAKGRPAGNPLIVHVSSAAMAQEMVVSQWPEEAEHLARAFWPGPLSLVLPKHHRV
ncbi:MAG: L-threonylcarbamoyladenylate synthase, partial [Phycisphaerales bacterium]|nr:L-threonylcarbamoyladenylate synthase [Phycisphaerales bacterium]